MFNVHEPRDFGKQEGERRAQHNKQKTENEFKGMMARSVRLKMTLEGYSQEGQE